MNDTHRAALWLGLPDAVVAQMPEPVRLLAARERGYGQAATPPDWLTEAIAACGIGSQGESFRLWRLLYVLAPFIQPMATDADAAGRAPTPEGTEQ